MEYTSRTALVDFDSIFYIIGHKHRDADPSNVSNAREVYRAVDSMLDMILTMTQSTHYILAVSETDTFDYRKAMYKYQEYKGNRGPKPDFILKWQWPITMHINSKWNLTKARGYEADDVIATIASILRTEDGKDYVICSPDKDLLQIPGKHWNYNKAEDQEMRVVTPEQSNLTYWLQVLSGDSTDNVAGVPGLGPIKAAALLKDVNPIEYAYKVKQAYIKYYGPHYGPEIMEQTRRAIGLEYNCLTHFYRANYVPSHEREVI